MGPASHQSTTWTYAKTYMHTWKHMEKQRVCRESGHPVYKKKFHMVMIVTDKWISPQDLVLILISQLEETS